MDARRRTPARDPAFAALALTFGAGAGLIAPRLPAPAELFVLALPAFWPWRGRAMWAVAVLGLLLVSWRGGEALDERWPAERHGETRAVRGDIVSLPEPGPVQPDGARTWRFQFRPAEAGAGSALPPLIRVSWYRSTEHPRGGDCWTLNLKLRTPRGSVNPGGFDYEAWLLREGIGASASVTEAERCEAARRWTWLAARQALIDRYQRWLPGHPGLPLLAALTVGDDSGISGAEWDAFRVTGTTHLVAISGFNVAIVAALAFLALRWAWVLWPALALRIPAQKAGLAGSAWFGVAYALLAGWEPPVQRAALMLVVFVAAALLDRGRQPARVLALAWMLVLLIDPFGLLSPGLWLSFGAVAAIFYVTSGRLGRRPAWIEALRVQWMLSLCLAPVTLYFFHGAAWLSPLVNLVAVPVVAVLTPLLLLAVALAWALPGCGVPLLGLGASALAELRDGLMGLAAFAGQAWWPASPPLSALLLALFGCVLLFAPRGVPLRLLALLCLLPLLVPKDVAPETGLRLAVLDVGQGLAVVARTAHHVLLYDAGPAFPEGFDAGESVVVPYLLDQGVRRIDTLLLSHGDNDHAGGVAGVRRSMRIEREIGTATGEPCRAGLNWTWDGVRFEVLHPEPELWAGNNASCVLRIDGGYSVLLAGDIEAFAEQRLVADWAPLAAQVLISPHHGSRSSSSAGFVGAVAPEVVVHGAAWKSRFGHPHRDVIERYRDRGTAQYVTGWSGALLIERGAGNGTPVPRVQEWRRVAPRWWRWPAQALEGKRLENFGEWRCRP